MELAIGNESVAVLVLITQELLDCLGVVGTCLHITAKFFLKHGENIFQWGLTAIKRIDRVPLVPYRVICST